MIAIIGPMNDHTVPEFVDNQHLIKIIYIKSEVVVLCILANSLHILIAIILISDASGDNNYWNW